MILELEKARHLRVILKQYCSLFAFFKWTQYV